MLVCDFFVSLTHHEIRKIYRIKLAQNNHKKSIRTMGHKSAMKFWWWDFFWFDLIVYPKLEFSCVEVSGKLMPTFKKKKKSDFQPKSTSHVQ